MLLALKEGWIVIQIINDFVDTHTTESVDSGKDHDKIAGHPAYRRTI